MLVESIERAPENEAALVSTLSRSFRDAEEMQREQTGPYLPGAQWKVILESQWRRYHNALDSDNTAATAALLRNFFRNEGLSGFWGGERMFEEFAALDGTQSLKRANLMRKQFEVWRAALPGVNVAELDAPHIGNPWGYIVERALLYEPACEYHYQSHYFANLLHPRRKVRVPAGPQPPVPRDRAGLWPVPRAHTGVPGNLSASAAGRWAAGDDEEHLEGNIADVLE
jgi:hypothetical protein